LAAILTADIAGYSRLMGRDKEGTRAALGQSGANWRVVERRVQGDQSGLSVKCVGCPASAQWLIIY
jgi:hypothetical protein